MSKRGVPVFNAPGANANAVKELVIAGMLIAARNLVPALAFRRRARGRRRDAAQAGRGRQEGSSPASSCREHTLGVIGLGKVGSLVADAAIKLGMNVLGYDPHITVDAAWSLPSQVQQGAQHRGSAEGQRFRHAARAAARRHAQPDQRRAHRSCMKSGAILLNFARDGIVDDAAVLEALDAKQLRYYVCDFPAQTLQGHPRRDRAAASRRLDARSRRQLRGHGGRPGARLSRAR